MNNFWFDEQTRSGFPPALGLPYVIENWDCPGFEGMCSHTSRFDKGSCPGFAEENYGNSTRYPWWVKSMDPRSADTGGVPLGRLHCRLELESVVSETYGACEQYYLSRLWQSWSRLSCGLICFDILPQLLCNASSNYNLSEFGGDLYSYWIWCPVELLFTLNQEELSHPYLQVQH